MIYLQLFLSFLQIGMFSFGGGYAAMPLIQGQVVTAHEWLTMSEFTDLITISRSCCGYGGMYPAVLHHRDDPCEAVSEIPYHGSAAGSLKISASGGGGHDRIGGDSDP